MDLTPYVDNLRHELAAAAESGGEESRALAERLAAPLESAARLALLNVLSDAMGEITRELAPGSVDVRLRGLDPDFVVTAPPYAPAGDRPDEDAGPAPAPQAAPQAPPVEDGGTARINLRLPTHLKQRAEEAAAGEGLSLNAWLVRAVSAAVEPAAGTAPSQRGGSWGRQSFTGWVR
ncbi:YlcI/YnfO family protein [Streptomyces boncukensis]|uniref:Toxin-antitoxin system HicB family antitoxin n=1 Tax=Streptomyces boncukensis TaxID=2711219 RepID=A0A6G4WW77_9ACTN|nr:YlcI/YnfO family protein [Streptomyces boncukensis]NGO68857.1 toxin-antitoxin system HicB family antitoxin [Streptomyces boncukensis]